MRRIGSRAQVMHGTAKMTGGGLRKKDLKYNKQGKIVSKKMSQRAKKEKRLQKAGYTIKKGQFGAVRSMRGGNIFKNIFKNMEFDKFMEEAEKDLPLNYSKRKFLLHKRDNNNKSMFDYFLERSDDDGKKIVKWAVEKGFINKSKVNKKISEPEFHKYLGSLYGSYKNTSNGLAGLSALFNKSNISLGHEAINIIDRETRRHTFKIAPEFSRKLQFVNFPNIKILSGREFLKKIMDEKKSSLTGTYNNVSVNEGFYLGQTYPDYIRISICNLARLAGWKTQWRPCELNRNKKNNPNNISLQKLIQCYCRKSKNINKPKTVYFFLPQYYTDTHITCKEFDMIIDNNLYKDSYCNMIFVYGMYEFIETIIDMLSLPAIRDKELIYRIPMTYRILTVCALCIADKKEKAILIENYLSINNINHINHIKSLFNNLKV